MRIHQSGTLILLLLANNICILNFYHSLIFTLCWIPNLTFCNEDTIVPFKFSFSISSIEQLVNVGTQFPITQPHEQSKQVNWSLGRPRHWRVTYLSSGLLRMRLTFRIVSSSIAEKMFQETKFAVRHGKTQADRETKLSIGWTT